VGQTSINLDLGTQSAYPDDGLSFNLDPSGNLVWAQEASDFNDVPNIENGDIYTPVFAVNYGQQNQNYFKNIKLDQREFAETMESLQIIEEISQTGDKSKPTYAGNNLFDVYQTRAYSAEVEMMGSAMIQPMMYFQLSNIPMFRGAYLIYKVNHKITPHSMVTTFKGNRAKKTKTPLLDKATMYMNLIGTQTGSGKISSRSSVSGTFPPIVQTIIDNGGRNGSVESGNITLKPIPFDRLKAIGDPFNKKNLKDENLLLTEAVEPLINMLNDWTDWMSNNGFKGVSSGNKKLYTYITSIFRDIAKQEDVKRQKTAEGRPKEAATPGTSPHGWAMAVDLQFFKKNGQIIDNKNSVANKSFDINVNPSIKWLYDNSYKYGWILPYSLRDGAGTEEHWHWEYHGKSAKCLVEKNPNVYGYKMDTSGTIKDFVKNPKDSFGEEAVYTGCDYRYIKMSDGSDGGYVGGNECPKITTVNDTSKRVEYKKVYKIAKNIFKELNKTSLSGMLGHFQYESNFNPTAYNSSGGGCGAFGIAQWRGNRFKNLEAFAIEKNKKIDDIEIQLEFIKKELQGDYKNVWDLLIGGNLSLLQATAIVHISFGLGNSNPNGYYKDITNQSEYLSVYLSKNGKTPQTVPKRYKNAEEFFNIAT
jgi:hypothetical protein